MNITNRLCNATKFNAVINWHAGIDITVPGDGFVDLDINQADDFRAGKPGSEEVQLLMDAKGIFLRDMDLPFEVQALACLHRCLKAKRTQYVESVNNIKARRAQQGIHDSEEALKEMLRQLNFHRLEEQIDSITTRIRFYEKKLQPEDRKSVRERVDPKKTIPWTNPPKTFETELQCQMWLEEQGEEDQKRHAAWVAANEE
jgi:hypothetical protein